MIDQDKLYKLGLICFTVIAICGVCNFFIFYEVNNWPSRISSAFSTLFNFGLAGFFWYLIKTSGISQEYSNTAKEIEKEFKETGK